MEPRILTRRRFGFSFSTAASCRARSGPICERDRSIQPRPWFIRNSGSSNRTPSDARMGGVSAGHASAKMRDRYVGCRQWSY
eukprot:3683107-Rhodomonas_salina.2